MSKIPADTKFAGFTPGGAGACSVSGAADAACLTRVRDLLEQSLSEAEIYQGAVQCARDLPGVSAAAIFLAPDPGTSSKPLELVINSGARTIPEPVTSRSQSGSLQASSPEDEIYHYVKIHSMGKAIGWLAVSKLGELDAQAEDHLSELAFLVGVAHERPRVRAQLKHYSAKLEVLNELNNLIASGVSLERIMRTIAREAAFRFAADCAFSLQLDEDQDVLEVKGTYGVPRRGIPDRIAVHGSQLGRALKLGGIMSVPDLSVQTVEGLEFLPAGGFNCAHWGSIDFRGEVLGAILIGYREHRELTQLESDMFEEFARGAAVAVANAKSQIKLAKYTGKLEELVEERTADLLVQTARADQANRAKSQFVANMSHELRTPLTAIVGYSSVLAEGVFGAINSEQEEALRAIARAGDHLKELINDVLDASKIEAGKEDPQPTEVDLYGLLEQIHKMMMQTALGKGITLVPLVIPEDEAERNLTMWVDARHIRQVLINIMSNAVKYTPSGGQVSVRVERMGDKARIVVSDTGVGISKAEQEKVFEQYSRSDNSYSKEQVGTGIGLNLTKRLVEINGGKIGLESEVGKGTDFWIMVPLGSDSSGVRAVTGQSSNQEIVPLSRLDGLNILVVDDNRLTCEVLKTIISSVGGNVYLANSVADAKEIAGNTALDTALVDLAIPGESGLDLLDYFRTKCEAPLSTMPLIVVSACVFDQDKEQAAEHGASTFVAKPFSPGEIINTIRELTTSAALNAY